MCHAAPKRARVARHAQEKAATPEKRPTVDKVVQNAVLNGMPTLAAANPAAAIIVTILTAMTAVQFWNAAPSPIRMLGAEELAEALARCAGNW